MASTSVKTKPGDITFDSIVVDLSFHPNRDVIAAGQIDGDINIFTYSTTEKNHELMTLKHHKKACRAIAFSPDGSHLITASKDKSIQRVDMEKGATCNRVMKAHECPVYSLLSIDENMVASGDDDGNIKLWDMRKELAVMEIKENEEFISGMLVDQKKKLLLATSGDGTLTAFNIRKHRMEMQSELFDSELLSLEVVKEGSKVVCGSGDGVLQIFNWGEWGNISDRFPGHPMSIDCMQRISDNIICTGSMDGVIRAVHILPNRFLGNVGEHGDFPVEKTKTIAMWEISGQLFARSDNKVLESRRYRSTESRRTEETK